MAVSHYKTVTVADGTATSVVRPSDWNSAHIQYMTLGGNTAGASTLSGSNIVLAGGSNVTLSAAGSTVSVVGPPTSQFLTTAQPPGAYLTTAQPPGAYLTTAGLSQDSSKYAGIVFAGTNATATLNTAGLSLSIAAPGGGGGAAISAGTNSRSSGTVQFANSNGVSFGMDTAGVVTATVTPGAAAGIAAITASNMTATSGTVGFAGSNAVTVKTSAGNVVVIDSPVYQAVGAYLTTAAQSEHTHGSAPSITGSIGVTSNSGAWSISIPAFLTTQSLSDLTVSQNLTLSQGTGASSTNVTIIGPVLTQYLTTAANSSHSHGNPTLYLTNLTGTTASASNGLSLSLSAAAPGAGGGVAIVGSNATYTSGSAVFTGAGAITIGSDTGQKIVVSGPPLSVLTAGTNITLSSTGSTISIIGPDLTQYLTTAQPPGAYLTTAMASNAGSNFVGLNSALTGNGVAWTVNSSGISLDVPAFLTTAANSTHTHAAYLTTARASNDAIGLNSALTANGVSVTANSSGLSLNFPAFLTTAQAPGAYLTTARASNDGIGLNTALTANGVAWTVNSSGLSLNVPAFLTTAAQVSHSHGNPTLALTNLTGTTASASNGLTISLSAANPGGGAAVANYWACPPWQGNSNALISNISLTRLTQRPLFFPFNVAGTLSANEIHWVMSRATNGTNSFTVLAGIYSYSNSSAINLISSTQVGYAQTATASISGVKQFECPMPVTSLPPGQYVLGLAFSANAGATVSANYSLMGAASNAPAVGGIVVTGTNAYHTYTNHMDMAFWGIYTTTSGAMPASVGSEAVSANINSKIAMYFTLGNHN